MPFKKKWPIFLFAFCIFLISCAHQPVVTTNEPALPPPPPPKTVKVAFVLGAGSAKGFAHIGVLKVFEMHKIPIHMIVGTSAGSLVGSFYAYGFSAFNPSRSLWKWTKGISSIPFSRTTDSSKEKGSPTL